MKHLLLTAALFSALFTCAQDAQPDMLAGMTALRKADHATAEKAFTAAAAASPDDPRTWYYRAVNRMESGDANGALSDLERSLSLDPTDVHTLLRRAEVLSDQGHHTQADLDLQRVLAIRPTGPAAEHALLLIGERQVAADDRVSAKRTYDRLVSIAPGQRSWRGATGGSPAGRRMMDDSCRGRPGEGRGDWTPPWTRPTVHMAAVYLPTWTG
jgi:tetratricopeptide (TPR) repeat protein